MSTSDQSDQTGPLIDLTYINNLADGDAAFVKSMIDTFLTNVPLILDNIVKLKEAGSWPELASEIHKLSPTLKYLGVTTLNEIMVLTEGNCKRGENLDQIGDGVSQILEVSNKVLKEAKEIVKS